jgi:CheY-like chemotaxis protein
LKILLVENSKTARAVLSQVLENEGYRVETVSTGTEALEALRMQEYDLLIMDVFMPEMNGYEATQKIRTIEKESNKPNIPIIAFTSSTSERDKRICLEAGMNEFILKSENNEALLAALKRYQT